jgi:nodulation protein E
LRKNRKVPPEKVVVTGMGAVSGAGLGAAALWQAARDGRSAIGSVELDRPGQNTIKIAAQVKNFNPADHLDTTTIALTDRFSQFAVVAADEAMTQANLPREQRLGERAAVIVGTGIGGYTTIDDMMYLYHVTNARMNPMSIPRAMSNAAACHLSMRYGCTGPAFAVSSACSSANQAIGIGASLIRSGAVDYAIVGGSEASIAATYIRAWELLRVLTPDLCRPFSAKRTGMTIGEGAGILVLENARTAQARGASALAEIAGYGTSSDARDLVRPDPAGAAAAMQGAIESANLGPGAIDYVNAHGTGTVINDVVETAALKKIFGDRLAKIPVSSTKPIHGHAIGASAALELIITIHAMREGFVPPTINWLEPDPKCDLDPVPNQGRNHAIRAAMSNSFAFGGLNAAIIVSQPS